MAIPWGNTTDPLHLATNNDLPRASRKFFQEFNGDGKVSTNEHIVAFFSTRSVIFLEHEDDVVRMFMKTLVDNVVDWFQHLLVEYI